MRKKTLQCWEEHERCQKDGTLLDTVYESESEVTQSCPTLCDPMDYSLSGSSIHEIFQARVLEWIPSPGDLPDPGIEPGSPALQADTLPSEPPGALCIIEIVFNENGSISFMGPLRKRSLKWSFKWKRSLNRSGQSSIIIILRDREKAESLIIKKNISPRELWK